MLVLILCSPARDTPCAGVRPRTTNSGGLFAICPDVAELLAVVAVRKITLGSIYLRPDSNMAEARQTENFLGLCRPWQGYEERERVYYVGLFGR
jgi:hypothetical protein